MPLLLGHSLKAPGKEQRWCCQCLGAGYASPEETPICQLLVPGLKQLSQWSDMKLSLLSYVL